MERGQGSLKGVANLGNWVNYKAKIVKSASVEPKNGA
jgi:hypothetical protein